MKRCLPSSNNSQSNLLKRRKINNVAVNYCASCQELLCATCIYPKSSKYGKQCDKCYKTIDLVWDRKCHKCQIKIIEFLQLFGVKMLDIQSVSLFVKWYKYYAYFDEYFNASLADQKSFLHKDIDAISNILLNPASYTYLLNNYIISFFIPSTYICSMSW